MNRSYVGLASIFIGPILLFETISYFVLALSRFFFTSPSLNSCGIVHEQKSLGTKTTIIPEVDEDGDILVQRLQDNEIEKNVITIGNYLSTSEMTIQ